MSNFIIGRRQTYILPTRIGWYFALILVAIFAFAIKFNNQPAFMMLFLLVALALISMIYTNNNLMGIELASKQAKPVFQGESAVFPLAIHNPGTNKKQAIWLRCNGFQHFFSIDGKDTHYQDIKLPTLQRGYMPCAAIQIASQFPIGLFFSWGKRYSPKKQCLVYPQPLDILPLPNSTNLSENQQQIVAQTATQDGDYSGLRPYQEGDNLRDIHWPSLAKTHKLASISYESPTDNKLYLSWFDLPDSLDNEEKLGQLCQWVISAEARTSQYVVELPDHSTLSRESGNDYHAILKALALWEFV